MGPGGREPGPGGKGEAGPHRSQGCFVFLKELMCACLKAERKVLVGKIRVQEGGVDGQLAEKAEEVRSPAQAKGRPPHGPPPSSPHILAVPAGASS